MPAFAAAAQGYLAELSTRPGARQPATFTEVWNAVWTAEGLNTLTGLNRPLIDAYGELNAAVRTATGLTIEETLAANNVAASRFYQGRAEAVAPFLADLDDEQRATIEPLLDINARAAALAAEQEREAAETQANAYGLPGWATAFLAGVARQAIEPVNLAGVVLGGPLTGTVIRMLGREALIGAGLQAVQEPQIQAGRAALGLEAGFGRALGNIFMAALGGAGFAGVLRLAGATVRAGVGAVRGFAAEDFDAAARLAERDQFVAAAAARPTAASQEAASVTLGDAAVRAEAGRPIPEQPDFPTISPLPRSGAAPSLSFEPNRIVYLGDQADALIRPGGARLAVRPAVVELGDLVVSHTPEGRVNPDFPAGLQPRDRTSAASQAFIAERAANLEPELLGQSPTGVLGAPVLGPDGVVEIGNGRAAIIRRVYEQHPDKAAAYRAYLEAQGFDLAGFKQPVMVRIREGEVGDRALFAREGNISATAEMSTAERAFADARLIDDSLLGLWRPGETQASGNAPFLRTFAQRIVPAEERSTFLTADTRLSAEGQTRVEAALVAYAWRAEDVVDKLFEATDPTSRAILGALADTAPEVGRMRAGIESGRIAKETDVAPAILEAFRLVERARADRQKIALLVDQVDIERGAVPPAIKEAVRLFYRNDELTQAAGRAVVAERIQKSVGRALDSQHGADMFGWTPDARTNLDASRHAGDLFDDIDIVDAPAPPPPRVGYEPVVQIDGKLYRGSNHGEAIDRAARELKSTVDELADRAAGGFVDADGKFVTRAEAYAREDAAAKPGEAIGDPELAAEADRLLAELGGDFEVELEGGRVSLRQAVAEATEDAAAARELMACIAAQAGGTSAT